VFICLVYIRRLWWCHPHVVPQSEFFHLGVAGAALLLLLMAKPGHSKPDNLRRYYHPTHSGRCRRTNCLARTRRRPTLTIKATP
ncbi:hypothetical protein ACFW1M_39405, partial [Streptomyces inhibens]